MAFFLFVLKQEGENASRTGNYVIVFNFSHTSNLQFMPAARIPVHQSNLHCVSL